MPRLDTTWQPGWAPSMPTGWCLNGARQICRHHDDPDSVFHRIHPRNANHHQGTVTGTDTDRSSCLDDRQPDAFAGRAHIIHSGEWRILFKFGHRPTGRYL